jgi:hypothetical protein
VNNEPAGETDDVLTFILLSIAVSGSDFKSDCYKWWSKATRLAFSLGLNREDEQCAGPVTPCANPLCSCRKEQDGSLYNLEHREERRRVFWLLYALDRHLALSFNSALTIPDSYCEVYCRYTKSSYDLYLANLVYQPHCLKPFGKIWTQSHLAKYLFEQLDRQLLPLDLPFLNTSYHSWLYWETS